MPTIYRATRTFRSWSFTCESFLSMEEAIYQCHLRAYQKNDWEPRKLRQKWWQFWRPTEHNDIEQRVLQEAPDMTRPGDVIHET